MASLPKHSPEPDNGGKQPDAAAEDRNAAAVLTPPPVDAGSSDAQQASDAPTLIDQPFDSPTIVDAGPRTPVSGSDAPTQIDLGAPSSSGSAAQVAGGQPLLPPGTLLAHRYEITALLGEGGMGAVYKANDRELNRPVALKVIRPDLARNQSIVDRFKQELLLAREVTHKNVIRIYDLGESEGLKFITMEFVEGEDLRTLLLRKKKLAPEEAVDIMQQVCRALDAAHAVEVIHRDLKPQNIMRDHSGRILVMDFGLARTLEGGGMTQTGALVGTMDYMSPEQALGKPLDQRSDLFAIGLIFYELLTGKMPYRADSAIASLLKRTQERAAPVVTHDPNIPPALSDIVSKCLDPDLKLRYQRTGEVLADLEAWQGGRAGATLKFPASQRPWGQTIPWHWVGGVAAVLLLAAIGFVLRAKLTTAPQAPNKSVSVLVADFTNHTGDPIFENTLEPMFNVALEGASFINAYSRGTAHNLAKQLPHPSDKLDEESARLIGVSQGLKAVVTGDLTLRGDSYKLSVEALDARTGNSIASAEITAPNKDELLLDIPKLAAPIRKALGDTTPVSKQLAVLGPFTVASLEVVHQYSLAMQQQFAGKTAEAFQSFSKAAELDPNFARAYAGMAGTASDLGKQADSEKYIKMAMEHLDRMTERERYHARGGYYMLAGDYPKCAEEFSTLVSQYPSDRAGQSDLAWCYAFMRNFPKALEHVRKAEEIAPKGALEHINLAFFSSLTGDFQTGEQEARTALQLSPNEYAQIDIGEAQFGQGRLSEAAETFHGLEKFGARGASMAASALSDLALYQGRFSEAVRLLEQGAQTDLKEKMPENAMSKFAALAQIELLRGQTRAAVAAAEKAVANGPTIQVRFLAGRVFAEAGEIVQAKKMADSLAKETQSEAQAYAKIIEGKIALKQGDKAVVIKDITDANNLLDTWIGRFELGRAYFEAGEFAEADSEFDRCIKRHGEAMELFMDNVVTYSYLPYVYYYQGRERQGLKTPAFADSFRTYLSIRGQSTEDPLVAEVKKSLGQ